MNAQSSLVWRHRTSQRERSWRGAQGWDPVYLPILLAEMKVVRAQQLQHQHWETLPGRPSSAMHRVSSSFEKSPCAHKITPNIRDVLWALKLWIHTITALVQPGRNSCCWALGVPSFAWIASFSSPYSFSEVNQAEPYSTICCPCHSLALSTAPGWRQHFGHWCWPHSLPEYWRNSAKRAKTLIS